MCERLEKMLAGADAKWNMTLQSIMVFEPQNRVIYLSDGQDAAHSAFHRLDLRGYFGQMKYSRVSSLPELHRRR